MRRLKPDDDEAMAIAIEHTLVAAQMRQTPLQIFQSLGMAWPGLSAPDWHDAALALSIAWRRLKSQQPRKAA
jgi:hypothetical protein